MGVVKSVNNGRAVVALRNTLKTGDYVEFLSTGLEDRPFKVTEILNENGRLIEFGKNEDAVSIPAQEGLRENDLVRRKVKAE